MRQEACLNMAGGQPFSIENLRGVRELTRAYGVPFILDATRVAENALFVKEREPGYADRTIASIVREIAELTDGAVFSSKKDHFVPIGGLPGAERRRGSPSMRASSSSSTRASRTTAGMAGHDMEALARGIHESMDEEIVRHYVGQSAYLGGLLLDAGVPIVVPIGAHAVFLDAKRFLPHLPQERVPRPVAGRRDLPRRRRAHDGAGHRLRPARPRAVRRARARPADDPAPRLHAGAPHLRRRRRRRPCTGPAAASPACGSPTSRSTSASSRPGSSRSLPCPQPSAPERCARAEPRRSAAAAPGSHLAGPGSTVAALSACSEPPAVQGPPEHSVEPSVGHAQDGSVVGRSPSVAARGCRFA